MEVKMGKIMFLVIMVSALDANTTPLGGGTGASDVVSVSNLSGCESLTEDREKFLIEQSLKRANESACKDFPGSYLHVRNQNTESLCITRKNIKTSETSTTVQFLTQLSGLCL